MRRTSSARRPTTQRRKLVWARLSQVATVTTGVPPALNTPARSSPLAGFETSYGAQLVGATIMRVRGAIAIAGQPTEGVHLRACMFIGDEIDIVRGATNADNAFDAVSASRDYFMMEPFYANTAAAATLTAGSELHGRLIDIKSHRKLDELNQSLVYDISAVSLGVANQNLTVVSNLSILVALP